MAVLILSFMVFDDFCPLIFVEEKAPLRRPIYEKAREVSKGKKLLMFLFNVIMDRKLKSSLLVNIYKMQLDCIL